MDTFDPYPQGEWLQLKVRDDLLPQKRIIFDEDEEIDDLSISGRILRGPHWNYGLRSDELFYSNLLYGKSRETQLTQEKLIVKDQEWTPSKPITTSLVEYLFRRLKKVNPKVPALLEIETGRTLLYREVIHKAQSLACGLQWIGILPGQVIALVSYNSLEAQLILLASLLVGSVAAMLDPSLNAVDLGSLLRIVQPRLIFCECGKTLRKVETALAYLMTPCPPEIVVNKDKSQSNNHFTFNQLLVEVEPGFQPAYKHANPDNPIFILFTSGTTGTAKGALISERFYMNNKMFVESVFALPGPVYTTLLSTPIFSINMISTLLSHLIKGHRVVFFRGPASEAMLFSALHKYKVVIWLTTPTTLIYMLDWPTKPRCKALKLVIVTGMPFPLKSIVSVQNQLFDGKVEICQIYGFTEAGIVTANTPSVNKIGSVGKVFFNVQMKVLEHTTGFLLEPNREGELCFKTNSTMLGYYRNPDATKFAIDEEMFFHTGDLGYYNEEGFVFITGRVKEIIKWKSYQISPSDIEAQLVIQPTVQEAVVFGIYHEKDGELVTAAVILKSYFKDTNPDVIEACANYHLSDNKKIRGGVHVFTKFPRTVTGMPIKSAIAKEVVNRINVQVESIHM